MTDISLQKIPPAVPIASTPGKGADRQEAPPPELIAPAAKVAKDEAPGKSTKADPLNRAAAIVEAHLRSISGERKRLTLEKHEDAGVVVYRAIDRDTGEVIKQFPPDSLLKLLSYYRSIEGLGVDNTV